MRRRSTSTRRRSTTRVSSNEDNNKQNRSIYFYHSRPIHASQTLSPLDTDAPSQDFRGFRNLVFLLLAVNNLRLIIENYLKYGFLLFSSTTNTVSSSSWWWWDDDVQWMVGLEVGLPLSMLVAYCIEVGTLRFNWSSRLLRTILYVAVVSVVLLAPNYLAYTRMHQPFLILIPCMTSCILALKVVSYALVQSELRSSYLLNDRDDSPNAYGYDIIYPHNVTMGNTLYFTVAPTLCYQPSYPRTERFRKWFFLKRLIELISLLGMGYFIMEQVQELKMHNI